MLSRAAIALMPQVCQEAIRDYSKGYDKTVQCASIAEEAVVLAQKAAKLYPDMVKYPKESFKPIKLTLWAGYPTSPDIHVYCSVASFSDVKPVISMFEAKGYRLDKKHTDDTYGMSRTFNLRKKEITVHVIAFALKDLGTDCRVVIIGSHTSSHEEYKIVCDEVEERAVEKERTEMAP